MRLKVPPPPPLAACAARAPCVAMRARMLPAGRPAKRRAASSRTGSGRRGVRGRCAAKCAARHHAVAQRNARCYKRCVATAAVALPNARTRGCRSRSPLSVHVACVLQRPGIRVLFSVRPARVPWSARFVTSTGSFLLPYLSTMADGNIQRRATQRARLLHRIGCVQRRGSNTAR